VLPENSTKRNIIRITSQPPERFKLTNRKPSFLFSRRAPFGSGDLVSTRDAEPPMFGGPFPENRIDVGSPHGRGASLGSTRQFGFRPLARILPFIMAFRLVDVGGEWNVCCMSAFSDLVLPPHTSAPRVQECIVSGFCSYGSAQQGRLILNVSNGGASTCNATIPHAFRDRHARDLDLALSLK